MIGGALFCNAARGFISVHNQVSLGITNTLASKVQFETEAISARETIKLFCTDNGVYTSKNFLDELGKQEQGI